jgi:hypothetical protein
MRLARLALPGGDPAHGDGRVEDIIAKHGGYTMAEHATTNTAGRGEPLAPTFLYGLLEVGTGLFCSFQQLMTTHDSIVGILQGGIIVPAHMSAQALLAFIQSNMDKDNRIAWTVAIVTQVIYWGAMLHAGPFQRRFLHRAMIWGFFALEVVTDLWYSIATNTTLGGAFVWIFNFGNGGWLVSLCYIAAMSAGSIFLVWRGLARVGKAASVVFASENH